MEDGSEPEPTIGDTIADPDASPFDDAVWTEVRDATNRALDTLPPREAMILRLQYGIGMPQLSAVDIALQFGVSPERIRQLANRALRKLRAPECADPLRNLLEDV